MKGANTDDERTRATLIIYEDLNSLNTDEGPRSQAEARRENQGAPPRRNRDRDADGRRRRRTRQSCSRRRRDPVHQALA